MATGYVMKHQNRLTADDLGLNGVAIDAAKTSSVIDLKGVSELAVYVALTRGGSCTRVDLFLDFSPEEQASYVQYLQQSIATAAGTGTASGFTVQHTVGGSENFEVRFTNINAFTGKLRIVSGVAGTAADTVVVKAITASL